MDLLNFDCLITVNCTVMKLPYTVIVLVYLDNCVHLFFLIMKHLRVHDFLFHSSAVLAKFIDKLIADELCCINSFPLCFFAAPETAQGNNKRGVRRRFRAALCIV